jgi:hypothetical protein
MIPICLCPLAVFATVPNYIFHVMILFWHPSLLSMGSRAYLEFQECPNFSPLAHGFSAPKLHFSLILILRLYFQFLNLLHCPSLFYINDFLYPPPCSAFDFPGPPPYLLSIVAHKSPMQPLAIDSPSMVGSK